MSSSVGFEFTQFLTYSNLIRLIIITVIIVVTVLADSLLKKAVSRYSDRMSDSTMRNWNTSVLHMLFKGFFSFMGLGFLVLSVFTLIPAEASKLNRLGYYSICSYSPISSIILLSLAAVSIRITLKKYGAHTRSL